jgi:hypothetical protein
MAINISDFNLLLSEFLLDLMEGNIPEDVVFENYKTLYSEANIYSKYIEYIPFQLLNIMKKSADKLINDFGEDKTLIQYTAILDKINTIVNSINIDFYKKYLLLLDSTMENPAMDIENKIKKLEDCLVSGEIENITYSIEYHNKLLMLYMTRTMENYEKIKITSAKLKALIATRKSLPADIFADLY